MAWGSFVPEKELPCRCKSHMTSTPIGLRNESSGGQSNGADDSRQNRLTVGVGVCANCCDAIRGAVREVGSLIQESMKDHALKEYEETYGASREKC